MYRIVMCEHQQTFWSLIPSVPKLCTGSTRRFRVVWKEGPSLSEKDGTDSFSHREVNSIRRRVTLLGKVVGEGGKLMKV